MPKLRNKQRPPKNILPATLGMLPRLKPISINGEKRKNAVERFVDGFIDSGMLTEDGIRGIWYSIKVDMEAWKPYDTDTIPETKSEAAERSKREKYWEDDINDFIGARLFERYGLGEWELYPNLGFTSEALDVGAASTPIILVCEKKTQLLNLAAKELGAGLFISSGQLPNFELAFCAAYIRKTSVDGLAYFIFVTDYDPAGFSIYTSFKEKFETVAYELMPDVEVEFVLVRYGATHEQIMSTYKNYTLPPAMMAKWFELDMGIKGVELNDIEDLREHIDRTIVEHVDPMVLEQLSVARAKESWFDEALLDNTEYQDALQIGNRIYHQTQRIADEMDYTFEPKDEWFKPIRGDMVEDMTTLYDDN